MLEIECKILDIDATKLRDKLESLGAKKVFDGEVLSVFFEKKELGLRKQKKTLRLRSAEGKTYFAYKEPAGPEDRFKVKEETELEVSSLETTQKILEALGFYEWLRIKKYRISYKLGKTRFEFDRHLDDFEYIQEYLEIEAPSQDEIFASAKLLGFVEARCLPWSLPDIIRERHPDKPPLKP